MRAPRHVPPLDQLQRDLRTWRGRAVASWVLLALLGAATCANYSATDDLVARWQLSVGETGARVHVQGGVVTVFGADGRKAVLTADGLVLQDPGGNERAQRSP